jgi:MFS family permease
MVALFALGLLPVFMITEKRREKSARKEAFWPWRSTKEMGLVIRLFIPNIVISMGAAILIPYMNLFFKETFFISDGTLGTVFAISSVVTGTATLASPLLAKRWGRIRSLVITQLVSVPFLLTIGFSPYFWAAGFAFWVRAALMNMGNPLYSAFAMAQVSERERATVSGLMGMSWNIGWAVGPYLSGYMQQHPNIGFQPIFLITCTLYILASILTHTFFQKLDDRQRRVALMKQIGVNYLPFERT